MAKSGHSFRRIWSTDWMDEAILGGKQKESPQRFENREASLRAFITERAAIDADIFLVQEANSTSSVGKLLTELLSPTHEIIWGDERGRAVIFRQERFKLASWTELKITRGLLVHLIDRSHGYHLSAASVHLPWMGKVAERSDGVSHRRRLFAEALEEIEDSMEPGAGALIGGDMNDPFHPAEVANLNNWRDTWFDLRQISPSTYPSFFDHKRFGHTFGERGSMTYDWIFVNSALKSVKAAVVPATTATNPVPFSDHMPVAADLQLVKGT